MVTKPPRIEELGSASAIERARRPPGDSTGRFLLGLLCGAALVGALWAFAAATGFPGRAAAIASPRDGDMRVSYMVQDTPSSASGSTIEGVSAIEFQPSYIVVRQQDGSGRVFFTERTRSLSWGKSPR
jgi:hypothetical protein